MVTAHLTCPLLHHRPATHGNLITDIRSCRLDGRQFKSQQWCGFTVTAHNFIHFSLKLKHGVHSVSASSGSPDRSTRHCVLLRETLCPPQGDSPHLNWRPDSHKWQQDNPLAVYLNASDFNVKKTLQLRKLTAHSLFTLKYKYTFLSVYVFYIILIQVKTEMCWFLYFVSG